jgi:hypothetical protein
MINRIGRCIGWTITTAIFTPLSPLALIYALYREVTPSGNGAGAWGGLGLIVCSIIACIVLAGLGLLTVANPVIAGIVYALWCIAVGIKVGS